MLRNALRGCRRGAGVQQLDLQDRGHPAPFRPAGGQAREMLRPSEADVGANAPADGREVVESGERVVVRRWASCRSPLGQRWVSTETHLSPVGMHQYFANLEGTLERAGGGLEVTAPTSIGGSRSGIASSLDRRGWIAPGDHPEQTAATGSTRPRGHRARSTKGFDGTLDRKRRSWSGPPCSGVSCPSLRWLPGKQADRSYALATGVRRVPLIGQSAPSRFLPLITFRHRAERTPGPQEISYVP